MILSLPGALAFSQSTGGSYVLRKVAIAAGAGRPVAAGLTLTATLGQAAAGTQSGDSLRLTGGFHSPRGGSSPPDPLFRNGFE